MKVVVTGANSAVGQAILGNGSRKSGTSISFVAAVRSDRAVEQLRSQAGASQSVVRISYGDPASLDLAFRGASAVIHVPGILIEKPGSSYEQANVETTRTVVECAKRHSFEKFVLVSAMGANEKSSNRYYRTKGQAEALVRESGVSYTVLRAPLLLGPHTAGAAALKRNVSRRRAKLIGGGRHVQQPLYVGDLARAAVAATESSVARNATLDLVGPVALPEYELVQRAGRLVGREIRIGSIPKFLLSFVLAIRQRVGRPGFSQDVLDVITADTRLDPQPAAREVGIQLTGIDEMIQASLSEG